MIINEPKQVLPLLEKLRNYKREHFFVILVHKNCEVLKVLDVTKHSHKNWCEFQQRTIFREALCSDSGGFIIAHNHPSGELHPSKYDKETTKTLVEGAKLLGLIVSRNGYFSFLEHDILN